MNNSRSQHTIEYVMVISVVIMALAAMVNILSRLCSNRLGHISDYVAEKEVLPATWSGGSSGGTGGGTGTGGSGTGTGGSGTGTGSSSAGGWGGLRPSDGRLRVK